MFSRVVGAGFALIAAGLLAVSIATPVALPETLSLFSGHPTVNDHTRETQDVYVGLYEAELCNSGGDGTCKQGSGEERVVFRYTGYAELGATGVLVIGLVALALLAVWNSERRNTAAWLVRIAGVITGAGAGGLIFVGPFEAASIPIGLGMAVHGAGIFAGLLASVIAIRRSPPIKLRVADRSQPLAAMPAPPPFDVHALFREDQGPNTPRPEPRRSWDHHVRPEAPQSTGSPEDMADPFGSAISPLDSPPGAPPGTASFTPPSFTPSFAPSFAPPGAPPPASPTDDGPLFSPAPQLRPLYDATPLQGGTGGLLPIERPVIPSRPPTPVSRASIDAETGMPAPPAFATERPKPRTLPPPSSAPRAKPPSFAPPPPLGPAPRTQVSLVPPMPDNDLPIASSTTQIAAAAPDPEPMHSDGRPDGTEPTLNTEPTPFPTAEFPRAETPLALPPLPVEPPPRPHRESQSPPPPPPVEPPPRPHRESQSPPPPPPVEPPPRPHRESQSPPPPRDTQAPRTSVRATVPMPARPARPGVAPTRPPPLAMTVPLLGAPPRPTISSPVVPPPGSPVIPVIPVIPAARTVPAIPTIPAVPAIRAIPAIPPLPASVNRAETDPDVFDHAVDQATLSRAPLEIGDSTSQTNVPFGMMTAEELDAAADDASALRVTGGGAGAGDASDADLAPHARPTEIGPVVPDTSPTGEPIGSLPESSTPAMPVAIAIPAPTPVVRDRPMPQLPISTAPDSLPPPRDTRQQAGPSPACPQCESPMAWVEEHLRFYCKSCRMYF